jgi:hypothetical protein
MGGTTQRVADENMTSFSDQMEIVWNNITNLGKSIGEILAPRILKLGEFVEGLTESWAAMDISLQNNIINFAIFTAFIGPTLLAMAALIKSFVIMRNVIIGIKIAMIALTSGPWGLVVLSAIAAAVGVVGYKYMQTKDAIDEIVESMEEMDIDPIITLDDAMSKLLEDLVAVNKEFKDLGAFQQFDKSVDFESLLGSISKSIPGYGEIDFSQFQRANPRDLYGDFPGVGAPPTLMPRLRPEKQHNVHLEDAMTDLYEVAPPLGFTPGHADPSEPSFDPNLTFEILQEISNKTDITNEKLETLEKLVYGD